MAVGLFLRVLRLTNLCMYRSITFRVLKKLFQIKTPSKELFLKQHCFQTKDSRRYNNELLIFMSRELCRDIFLATV